MNPVSYTHLDVYKRQLAGNEDGPGIYNRFLSSLHCLFADSILCELNEIVWQSRL